MAHQAIYRKWRPMTFDDIVGQQHVTKTLKNQILSGTVGHAYLFCGTRGTGKTTCAKVLARAVNCLNLHDGNPCNECAVCKGILDGSIMDVTEMDAASNNGVDDIRDIKDDINYVSSNTKYTVYIIDEVHMLSTSAFNALLKTLEEPPENVIFILATTESHKVPQTILSRCQRFDFKRIKNDDITVRMKEIAYADGYSISDAAYRMLAQLADGSMRDGLSIMERVISACGDTVDEVDIVNTLGISTQESVFELTDAIINGDSVAVIRVIDKTMSDGKDLAQLANSMIAHFRALMICKLSQTPETFVDCDAQTMVRYKSQSEKLTFEKINHAASLINNALNDARFAKSARIIYELAFIKLTRPEIDRSDEAIMDRIALMEQKLMNAPAVSAVRQQSVQVSEKELEKRISAIEKALTGGVNLNATEVKREPVKKKKVSARLYSPIPKEELCFDYPTAVLARNWSNTIENMMRQNSPMVMPLRNCSVTFDADGIIVIVPEERYKFTERMTVKHIDEIRKLFAEVTGSRYTIKIVKHGDIDEERVVSPFELPHTEMQNIVAEPVSTVSNDDNNQNSEVDNNHNGKLNEFIERFSEIITDGDREIPKSVEREMEDSRQALIEDDREEFLSANELSFNEGDD